MANETTPLVQDATAIQLYDPQAMISMSSALAEGYMILLSGGGGSPNNNTTNQSSTSSASTSSLNLSNVGFLALTQGNVLDACFGMTHGSAFHPKQTQPSDAASPKVQRTSKVQQLKLRLAEAAHQREAIVKVAVDTYLQAFEIVVNTNQEVDQLNFLTRCFFYHTIVHKAQDELVQTFCDLQDALAQTETTAAESATT